MVDYSKLSDFEINGLIAMRTQNVGDFTQARGLTFIHEYGNPVEGYGALCLGWKEFDPCSNPADAWPIIAENAISIIFDAEPLAEPPAAWCTATNWVGDMYSGDIKKPLRAAMIVFLMMRDAKNG